MKKILRTILLIICLAVFLYSAYRLYDIFSQNHDEKETVNELVDISGINKGPKPTDKNKKIDFKALQEKNPDIIAWLYIPDTHINYPIVRGTDNDYYLTHAFDKSVNYCGSVFMDYRNDANFKDPNTLVYGHYTRHGTMFADIQKFKDKEFFDQHPKLYIYTPNKNYICDIYSIQTTYDGSDFYRIQFDERYSYEKYIKETQVASDFIRDIKIDTNDHIVSFSTCSYERNNEASELRYLLHAVMREQ